MRAHRDHIVAHVVSLKLWIVNAEAQLGRFDRQAERRKTIQHGNDLGWRRKIGREVRLHADAADGRAMIL